MLIYKATFPNQKCYIGQTVDFENRKSSHKSCSFNENNVSYNYPFSKAVRKYGWENIKWEILNENLPNKEHMDMWERLWIFVENSNDPKFGYNITIGGEGLGHGEDHPNFGKPVNLGNKFSEEHKKKLSIAKIGKPSNSKGKPRTEETKQKMRKPRSEEFRKKLTGRKLSEEHKRKLSDSMKRKN